MPDRTFIRTCSIWRALEVVGDTATLLILEASWLGVRRFDEFRVRTGILRALLSDRLKRLVAAEILVAVPYSATPPRHEYRLTQKGRDLYWTALMMLRWERRWAHRPGKIGLSLRHTTCGGEIDPTPACACCRGEIRARDVAWSEGPGVGWMAARYSRRRHQREAVSRGQTALLDEVAQITGDRWASLVLRSVFTGKTRFDEIRNDTAMATNVLAERISWLCGKNILRQRPYQTNPVRYEYRLTEQGIDYYPVLLMLLRWGDRYYVAPEGPPLVLQHTSCGHELEAIVACSACGDALAPEHVEFRLVEARPADFQKAG